MNAPFLARHLWEHQQRAATFLYERDAAFLIAPLGAGKGAAALTALAELIRDKHRRHALVIAPKLVATTVWPTEVTYWPHLAHLRVAVLDGSPERRRELLAAASAREVTVIGVDLVPWLVGELAAFAADHPLFDVLIIDETSKLKDPSGKRARALAKIAGRFRTRWGLTGTPRPNSSRDLFMPAAIITDGELWGRAFVPWQKRHFRPRDPFGREWIALPGAEEQIATDFATVAMTVADEDMPDLPPLNIVVTPLKLPDAVMAKYRTMARELFAEDRRALDRSRLAADRNRQAGAAGERLPLRRRRRRSGARPRPEDRLVARAGREPRWRAAPASPTSSSKTCAPSGAPSGRCRRSAVRRRRARRRSSSRPGMRGRCRCSRSTRLRLATGSICSTAGRAWRGCRRAGRPS